MVPGGAGVLPGGAGVIPGGVIPGAGGYSAAKAAKYGTSGHIHHSVIQRHYGFIRFRRINVCSLGLTGGAGGTGVVGGTVPGGGLGGTGVVGGALPVGGAAGTGVAGGRTGILLFYH